MTAVLGKWVELVGSPPVSLTWMLLAKRGEVSGGENDGFLSSFAI